MKFNSLSSSNVQIGRPQNKKCGSAISGDHTVLAGGFLPYQNLTNAGCHIMSGQHIGCRADKDTEAIDKCIIFKSAIAQIIHLSTAQQHHYNFMR